MKKGLLVYKAKKTHKNIGDYIQSLAAEQYTGRDVVFLEREHLHEYSGEPLKLIMNGWFMHVPENWPPSKDIIPLLKSVHINPDISETMLSEKGIEYFKKYGPVGCRDKGTEKLLKSKGVDAYFSACLTLTLGKTYQHDPKGENICFVDPHFKVSKSTVAKLGRYMLLLSKRKTISKISSKFYKSTSRKHLVSATAFYQAYSKYFDDAILENAEYIHHMILESTLGSEESKLDRARSLLTKYAASRLVVTSRIHAALPCLGMDTPVIFVVGDDLQPQGKGLQPKAKGRFGGLIEFFNVMECMDNKLKPILGFSLDKKIGLNHSIRNKKDHLKYAEELDKSCTAFIKDAN